MKCVIEIFENGDRTDVLVSDDKYNWDGYSKLFSDKKCSYVKKDTIPLRVQPPANIGIM